MNIKGLVFVMLAAIAACAAYDLLVAKRSAAKEL